MEPLSLSQQVLSSDTGTHADSTSLHAVIAELTRQNERLQSIVVELLITNQSLRCGDSDAAVSQLNRFGTTIRDEGDMNIEKVQSSLELPEKPVHSCGLTRNKSILELPYPLRPQHRILCVDDEVEGTTLRGQIIEEHGYPVALYHCPLAALQCDLSKFSLAVLDFKMPGLNGRELFLRMRASGARFPVVLLTGTLDSLSYEDRVLFARCIDKSKPVQYLLEAIDEFLGPNQIPDFGS